MKNIKNGLLLLVAMFAVQAIQAQEDAPKKKEKVKMIMIKKTIDEDGNETIEKIVKEGEEAEKFILIEKGENGKEDVRIIIKEGDEEIETNEEIEIEIEREEEVIIKKGGKKMKVEVEEKNGQKTVKVENEENGEVEVQVITLEEGEELPADVKKQLEALGIDLDEMRKESASDQGKTKKKSKKKVKTTKKEKKAYK